MPEKRISQAWSRKKHQNEALALNTTLLKSAFALIIMISQCHVPAIHRDEINWEKNNQSQSIIGLRWEYDCDEIKVVMNLIAMTFIISYKLTY